MDEIKLVFPTGEYKEQLEKLKAGFGESDTIHGTGGLERCSVDEWLTQCADFARGVNMPDGYVPSTQFISVRERDNKVVGFIQVRHILNDKLLQHGGHIGYMIAEGERRKGYATEQLRLCLRECKKLGIDRVLITCQKWNVGSAKTIIANGGKLENETEYEGGILQRYWIEL